MTKLAILAQHEPLWIAAADFAADAGINENSVRVRFNRILVGVNGTRHLYVHEVPSARGGGLGGKLKEYDIARMHRDFPGKISDEELSRARARVEREAVQSPALQFAGEIVVTNEAILEKSAPAQGTLQLDSPLHALPERARPWAQARKRAIEPLLSDRWKSWKGKILHGVAIHTKTDFALALAKDSACGNTPLVHWADINHELSHATHNPEERLAPVKPGALWRWHGWKMNGREVNGQQLVGDAALGDLPRSDAGTSKLPPEQQHFLLAAAQGGDPSVDRASLALERERSTSECRDLLRLELHAARIPGKLPSYSAIHRFLRNTLPKALRDQAALGSKRALARSGCYIVRNHDHLEVNDAWYCDFRRVNVRGWFDRERPLYRIWLCGILDAASRDAVIAFGMNPSVDLFKTAQRMAYLRWGVCREIWMDNGKEFTSEEFLGDGSAIERRWKFEVDADCTGLFGRLGIEPHYCIKENPDGKGLIERFFQTFDHIESKLPGSTGNDKNIPRPQRLEKEERLHRDFTRGLRPDTPLLHASAETEFAGVRRPGLKDFLLRMLDAKYRQHTHRGDGMLGRAPAQVQAAFSGERRIPAPAELDILLWKRVTRIARGDKISLSAWGRTFYFRHEKLLLLPGDASVEVHVDPNNVDRAIAFTPAGPLVLEPVIPTGGARGADVAAEIKRQRALEREMRRASVFLSRLSDAPVLSPAGELAAREQFAAGQNAALESHCADRRMALPLPEMSEAIGALESSAHDAQDLECAPADDVALPDYETLEPVFTSPEEAERWHSRRKPA